MIWSRSAAAEAARRPATPGAERSSVHLPVLSSITKAWLVMASQVFFVPMPMKEKIFASLPVCVRTTALLETAIGSGLSLGSSAALTVEARKRKRSAGKSFFIGEILAAARARLSSGFKVLVGPFNRCGAGKDAPSVRSGRALAAAGGTPALR